MIMNTLLAKHMVFFRICVSTFIVAPAGARHLIHNCVTALNKGTTIACEPSLAAIVDEIEQMTSSHPHCLNGTAH